MPRSRPKGWNAEITRPFAKDALDAARVDPAECRRLNVKLLRKHQEQMVPYSEGWMRAEATIRNLQAQQ